MILENLELYNSSGCLEGLKLDTVKIDFTGFKEGLVGLFGRTGTGKSSIMTNCHHFRGFPSKDGLKDFKDGFESDGYRKITSRFKDRTYESHIYVNKALLFKDGDLLNKSQKVSEYDEAVEEEFGDPKAFFKLLFAGSRMKNILEMTKGEKKQLIVDYLLDYLKKYEIHLDKLSSENTNIINSISGKRTILSVLEPLQKERINLLESIELSQVILNSNREALDLINKNQQDFKLQEEENRSIKEKIKDIEIELSGQEATLFSKEREFNEQSAFFETKKSKYKILQDEISEITKKQLSGDLKLPEKTEEELRERLLEISKLESQDEIKAIKNQEDFNRILNEETALGEKLIRLEKNNLPCSSDLQLKCPLTKNQNFTEILYDLTQECEEKRSDLKIARAILNQTVLGDYRKEINDLKVSINIYKLYNENKIKISELETLKNDGKELKKKASLLEKDIVNLKVNINESKDFKKYQEGKLKSNIFDKTLELIDTEKEISKLEEKINNSSRRIEEIDKKLSEFYKIDSEITKLEKDAEEYPLLMDFFGKTGGMIYDLEKAGDEISAISNQLMENFLYQKILIRFDTLKRNSKNELKEIFDIVNSVDNGKWKTDYSGGQGSLITNAVVEGLIHLQPNKNFKTRFADEMDGALDGLSRPDFMRLLKQGNELNKRYQTYIISHSPEVQGFIEQSINLEKGKIILKY